MTRKNTPATKAQTQIAAEEQQFTLFEHLLEINKKHALICGDPNGAILEAAGTHIAAVSETFGISPLQAVLFADIFAVFDGENVGLDEIARNINCKPIEFAQYIDEFGELEHKNLIERFTRRDRLKFYISYETLAAVKKGKRPDNLWEQQCTTPVEFLDRIETLYSLCKEDDDYYPLSLRRLKFLLENNPQLKIVKQIGGYGLSCEDAFHLLCCIFFTVQLGEEEIKLDNLITPHYGFGRPPVLLHKFESGNHPLVEKGLVEPAGKNGMMHRKRFRLTEKAKNEFLVEFELKLNKEFDFLTAADKITAKQLFYPAKTEKSIGDLSHLLQEEHFNRVCQNLKDKGMRTGFACLFSGGPGTGKTETARQLARRTGRNIMQIEISETKSCWFGESEKRIEDIFSRYRTVRKSSGIAPILLFNEADAVISKRMELSKGSNVRQTENAIQNILLQEIENLDGILIATTNLTQNMDQAFERRFLYKIEFENPTLDARKSIWQTLIPELSEEDIDTLAAGFDFSGGQIENISRRRTIWSVLHGEAPPLDELISYCREESAGSTKPKRIGFTV
ncbi:MAG: AAA family ATPase [Planctomycetaceae bacterium]|nr:AAA family ATPase [Planctomycetaceae bacterium]